MVVVFSLASPFKSDVASRAYTDLRVSIRISLPYMDMELSSMNLAWYTFYTDRTFMMLPRRVSNAPLQVSTWRGACNFATSNLTLAHFTDFTGLPSGEESPDHPVVDAIQARFGALQVDAPLTRSGMARLAKHVTGAVTSAFIDVMELVLRVEDVVVESSEISLLAVNGLFLTSSNEWIISDAFLGQHARTLQISWRSTFNFVEGNTVMDYNLHLTRLDPDVLPDYEMEALVGAFAND